MGCAAGLDAGSLSAFFAERLGPLLGADYPHVYPLGGDRHLWLFQDGFIDHGGTATRLDQASFIHNLALEQRGRCFSLLHRGTATRPQSFEAAIGEHPPSWWFWPLGGEVIDGRLFVFWAEMDADAQQPVAGDGLGWHPVRTWLATYDVTTLARLSFAPAPQPGAEPLYGYGVASDHEFTYLFGNTFEQNLARHGGFWRGPHSATRMWLARVPRGRLDLTPEYRTSDGWSSDPAAARPISERFWAENPMQPRLIDGLWQSVAKVDGYWGEELVIDVAPNPWGPWTTVERRDLWALAGERRLINTYHAYLMPWSAGGGLVISVSQNARFMDRDGFPHPHRYRPMFVAGPIIAPPPPAPPTTAAPSTTPPTTIAPGTSTSAPPTTLAPTSTTAPTTTVLPTTTTAPPTTLSTTTTTAPPTTAAPTTSAPATSTSVSVATTIPSSTSVAPITTATPAA